jgi:hypothetical protein
MEYANLTDKELKNLFFAKCVEVYSKDYLLGWLKSSYLSPMDAPTERQIIINNLNDMYAMEAAA